MKQLRKYAAKVTVPLLVMHSRVDTRTNFTAAKDFYDWASSVDKKMIAYDDASHLLFQDLVEHIARAMTDLIQLLDERYA